MHFIRELIFLLCFIQRVYSQCGNYFGPEVTVRISAKGSAPKSVLWVSCDHNSTEFDISSLPNCSFPLVTIVRFDFCCLNKKLNESLVLLGVRADAVKEIVLSLPKVERIDYKLLQGFPQLTSFIVYNGNISNVSEEAFRTVPNLKRLILNDNLFETLPSTVFWNLTKLKVLILNRQITNLPEELFSRNVKLEILHLYSNKLRHLPEKLLHGLTSLKTLSLSNNQLNSFNVSFFRDCASLEHLNLKKNDIRLLSQLVLTNCTKLETIDLSNNELKSIPESIFQKNYNLTSLIFDSNFITEIPESLISHLLKLQNISFSENEIKLLPDTFLHNNEKIIRLELRGNHIKMLPTLFFSKSHRIKLIDLSKNNITTLPDRFFAECLSLEKLKLDTNHLSSLSLNQFPSMGSNLKEINLSRNHFKLAGLYQFGSFVLANQISLYHIDLSFNNIEQMPYALYTFPRLKHLDLQNNNITFFSFEFLREIISRGVAVNVRNNSISTISGKVIFPLELPAVIEISGNPLSCDCKLFDFANFLRGNKGLVKNIVFTDVNKLRCSEPGNIKGTEVRTVDLNNLTCNIPANNASKCSTICDCVVQPSYKRILVDCSARNLTEVPSLSMRHPIFALNVDLSSNSLVSFNFSHSSYSSMANVSLENNSISDTALRELLPQLPIDLKYISVRGNNISSVDETFIDLIVNRSILIDFSGDNWECNCNLKSLHTFLQTKYNQVYNVKDVYCVGYDTPLIDLTSEDICLGSQKLAAIIVLPLIAIIIAVLVTVTFYKYQTALRVWLYSKRATRWLVTEKDLDADKEYDAFLSYSHEDENFINDTLVPGLENGDPKYKVCLHYRDWRPGELIQTQILESVANSRRTIVILSKNFIKSVWGKMEFRVAHQKALTDNTNRVIVIVYGEMPPVKMLDDELKHYISTRTYLNYDNTRFWDNLRYAMPHKDDGTKRNMKLEKCDGHITIK